MPTNYHNVAHAAEFLHTVHPFNALETGELNKLARKLEAAYYPQGKTIFSSRPSPGLKSISTVKRKIMSPRLRRIVFYGTWVPTSLQNFVP
jgi:hypothetical protein